MKIVVIAVPADALRSGPAVLGGSVSNEKECEAILKAGMAAIYAPPTN